VIPGDIGAELAAALTAAADAGELPAAATGMTAAGTWRPAPAQAGGGPGSYATSLPFRLARLAGRDPVPIAAALAGRLAAVPWIAAADVTGAGYLTVTVTAARLAGLAARIVTAGPAAARSEALAGRHLTAPGMPDLAAAASWEQAWRSHRDALAGYLARTAGATVTFFQPKRLARPASITTASLSPVSAATAYHGQDAVRYALARTATGGGLAIERQLSLTLDLVNPFVAVRYAHADAASCLRWAAELGLPADHSGGPPPGPVATPEPPELKLLDLLSWLPERVAAAARRHRPAELAAYLEHLAGSWLDCRESCPALPFCGAAALADPATVAARLQLADAARAALAAGLGLLAVAAPARI
jgi:arginyl-tRNA synthetase